MEFLETKQKCTRARCKDEEVFHEDVSLAAIFIMGQLDSQLEGVWGSYDTGHCVELTSHVSWRRYDGRYLKWENLWTFLLIVAFVVTVKRNSWHGRISLDVEDHRGCWFFPAPYVRYRNFAEMDEQLSRFLERPLELVWFCRDSSGNVNWIIVSP